MSMDNQSFREMLAKRHANTRHLFSLFDYGHLPEGQPRRMAADCTGLAIQMLWALPDGIELSAGLRKLVEAKDCFVRQSVISGGRADELPGGS